MMSNPSAYEEYGRLSGDPRRAVINLSEFAEAAPDLCRPEILKPAARLFGASQFLATYVKHTPEALVEAIQNLRNPVDPRVLSSYTEACPPPDDEEGTMKYLRNLRKRMILRIALRDLLGQADLPMVMLEFSWLADFLIGKAMEHADSMLRNRYGDPSGKGFTVFALGKLGGQELNFSSDVDLIYAYGEAEGETSGVMSAPGVQRNRISNHEYYCKLAEQMGRILSLNTADGFVYRVDTRLRPEGARGALALPLSGFELYYESFGREWERAALIRLRPVAGDTALGQEFLDMVRPFVYRKSLDYGTIEDLKRIKLRIDSKARENDIKRGRGGIREIEFFVQSFQLIYGGREPLLRERNLLKALHLLNQKGMLGYSELEVLGAAYRFLRYVEHRLQMVQDLQTQSIPNGRDEREALARNMGFPGWSAMAPLLAKHRDLVNALYRSLFHDESRLKADEERKPQALLFSEEATEHEIRELLKTYDFQDLNRAAKNLEAIRETRALHQTIRTRRLLGRVLPRLFNRLVETSNPDRALANFSAFLRSVGPNEAYLSVLNETTPLADHLMTLFAETDYLSRLLIASPHFLDVLREQGVYGYRTLAALKRDLAVTIQHTDDWALALRRFKLQEELRLGLLYLNGEIPLTKLLRALTKTAEAVLEEAFRVADHELSQRYERPAGHMTVIGLGKFGGWEMTYGSDLDIIFIHSGQGQDYFTKLAERIVNVLSSYTRLGVAYKVDTRLRPTGSKGPLVQDIAATRRYYIEESELWERQALLRARPVAGNRALGENFFWITREAVAVGAREPNLAEAIRGMRARIEAELSKETLQYDLKFGPGGLNELEFMIQFLQLRHAQTHPRVIIPNTPQAIHRLESYGLISGRDAEVIGHIYQLYREIETVLRLTELSGVPKEATKAFPLARALKISLPQEFLDRFQAARQEVRNLWDRLVVP